MEQLSRRATSFLNMENAAAPTHVGTVSLFDPAPDGTALSADKVQSLVLDRIGELPQYRRRLLNVPLGLDRPYWVEDENFDLEFHVRHIGVPKPGGLSELAELIARLHARPLDRARPLWELYIVEGLASGQVAWYAKTHHACLDSFTGAEIMNALLDTSAESRPAVVSDWNPDRVPGTAEMLGRSVVTLATHPRAMLRLQRRMARMAMQQASSQIPPMLETMAETFERTAGIGGRGLGRRVPAEEYLSRPALVAPRLSFNGKISAHRRVAFGSLPLEDFKKVKRWASTDEPAITINDIVMAACAGGLRTWLDRRLELPGDPLLALVPVLHDGDEPQHDTQENRSEQNGTDSEMSAMIAALPTNEPDPGRRLQLAHAAMSIAKDEHSALPAELLQDLGAFAPPAIAARAAHLVSRLGVADMANPRFNVVISNIPGPQSARYAAGHHQAAAFPVPVIADGAGLNITLLSYEGQVHLGLAACRDAVDDLAELLTDIEAALTDMVALAAPTSRRRKKTT